MPVRKIPRSYCHVTGLVSSEKSGEMIAYESRPERYFIKQVSFNPNVKSCEEQPVKIPYSLKNGKPSHYTPDFLVHFNEHLTSSEYWKPLLVEVKPRHRLFKDWAILHPKFLAAREYSYRRGWEFTIITDRELVTPYLDNIIFLTRYRNYPISKTDEDLVLDILENLANPTPESILQKITKDNNQIMHLIPVLWKLVANFEIGIDLEVRLNMHSHIWKKPIDEEEDYERIHSLCAGRIGHARWRALRYYTFTES